MDEAVISGLETVLKALASGSRLRLLVALQEPRRVSDIALESSRQGPWGSKRRAISRQAVRDQLRALEDIGVVERIGAPPEEVRFVVNHARLYELTENLRTLATVRPTVPLAQATRPREAGQRGTKHPGPHIMLVRGVREGQAFPLGAPPPPEGWLIGRAAGAAIRLDYDPFVSNAHARVLGKEGRHFLADLHAARNRTFLNWEPMVRGAVAPLEPGDLIGVGMSLLLYRR